MKERRKDDKALKESKAEVNRLVKNWRALLDIMPQMVFLIREDLVIEYINLLGKDVLGDICGKRCPDMRHVAPAFPIHGGGDAPASVAGTSPLILEPINL